MIIFIHSPYIIPKDIPFRPKHTDVRGGCVEYADWSIGHFLNNASKQPWFHNTIFVFVSDHGAIVDNDKIEDMFYSYNHIPFIIYSQGLSDAPKVINQVGGQIDIFPTIAGLLHLFYVNNTMGIDLLNEKRHWISFSADDKLAVTDSSYFFLWHKDGRESLYKLKNKSENIFFKK